jgi:hypothetical protein
LLYFFVSKIASNLATVLVLIAVFDILDIDTDLRLLPPHSAARLHSMFMDDSCNCMRAPRANEGPGAYASACAPTRRSQDVFLSHVALLGPFGPTGYVFYLVLFSPSDGISVISCDS